MLGRAVRIATRAVWRVHRSHVLVVVLCMLLFIVVCLFVVACIDRMYEAWLSMRQDCMRSAAHARMHHIPVYIQSQCPYTHAYTRGPMDEFDGWI